MRARTCLGMLRDGKLKASAEMITGLLALLDRLRGILRTIEADGDDGGEAGSAEDVELIGTLAKLQAAKPKRASGARRIKRSGQERLRQPGAGEGCGGGA